jgi:iron complex outermembrane receptor protein
MSSCVLSPIPRFRGVGLLTLALALSAAEARAAEASADTQVEEVVVTSTKRAERAVEVPIALSAFGPRELATRQPRDIADLATAIPNVSLTTSGSTLLVDPVIRGISSNTRNAGVESGLAVYVDGVYTGRPETFDVGLQDARTVEVLRGPQGTLFGKNAIAGALSVTTEDPQPGYAGRAMVQVGSENELRALLVANAPLGGDGGARVTLYRDRRDGYVRNLFDGGKIGDDNDWGGRLKAKFSLADGLDMVVAADLRHDNRHPYFGETPNGVDPLSRAAPKPVIAPGPFTIDEDHKPDTETRTLWGASATLTYHSAGGFTLSSITAERGTRRRFAEDNDSSPADTVFVDFFDKQQQFTQELRVVSPDAGRLKYVAGLYYFAQTSRTRHTGELGTDFVIPGLIPGGVVKAVTPSGRVRTDSYAAYVDASYALTGQLDLLAGARVTQERKRVDFSVTPDALIAPLFYDIPPQTDRRSDLDVSPSLGARYHIQPGLIGYVRVARGYKSGGWNLDFIGRIPGAAAPTLPQLGFRPEKVTNYEAGVKGDLLAHRLTFDLAVFDMDYRNLQVTQFFGLAGGGVTSNAATATIRGIEGDASVVVLDGLTVSTSLGFNDAHYDHFANVDATGASADGKRLPGPRFTGSLEATYRFQIPGLPGDLSAFSEYSYRSSAFAAPLNEPRLKTSARGLVNARLSWSVRNWTAGLFAENLFDQLYVDTASDDPFASSPEELVTYGRPRTWGVNLTARF